MGQLVHDSSKSLTARIIGRLKGSLIEFRAPQASFSVNSLAALSKAVNLVRLDLSLMSAGVQHRWAAFPCSAFLPWRSSSTKGWLD